MDALPPQLQIYFYAYSLLRGSLVNARRRTAGLPPLPPGSDASRRVDVGVPGSLAVAAVAGVLNMIATSPAQVLTTRMQAASAQRRALEGEGRPTQAAAVRVDVLGVAADIWAADGMAGFWRGG
jgi:Mitochondrial carrier protein